jgi:hypothetical protein
MSNRTALGRMVFLPAVAVVVFIFGAVSARAFGGGPSLAPVDSPYAILEPQTVTPLSKQTPTEVHSDRMRRAARRLPPRRRPAGFR